jgi:hypothetical protein
MKKNWILIIAVGLAAGAAVYLLWQLIVAAAVSAVVASLVTILVYRILDKKPERETAPKVDPAVEVRNMFDGLVEINIRIREEGLPSAVISRVEGIIDKLRELLPDINERHPTHELTWTLNQMAKEYLPKVINPYLALSLADRTSRQKELLESLNGLEAEIDNVAELVQGEKMGDFKAKAAFLRARFVQGL